MTIRFHPELSKLPSTLCFQHECASILKHRHIQFRWNAVMRLLYYLHYIYSEKQLKDIKNLLTL